jgi:hypothetical protein
LRRLVDILGSLRLTLILLLALVGLFALGLAVPQRSVLGRQYFEQWQAGSPRLVAVLDGAGITDVQRSGLATALWGAFFANLAFVMGRRLPATLRRVRLDAEVPDPADAAGFTFRAKLAGTDASLERARAFFQARGYAVRDAGSRFRAVRHRLTPLATLGFHLSFFLVAVGAVISGATRFEGNVDLGQGEQFTGALEQYASPPRMARFGSAPASRFLVEAIEPRVVGNIPVQIRVHLRDGAYRAHVLEVNQPYRSGDDSFVFKNLGLAPALLVTDEEGRELFAGLIRLDVLLGKTDRFTLLGREFTARLFPDYVKDASGERSRSQEMRDPVLRLETAAPGGEVVGASVRPGDAVAFGARTITFVDWRYWVRLYVRSERGLWLLWLGFALGAGAVAWRLLLFRREWIVAGPPGHGLVVAARADFYRARFADEAARIARDLERELTTPPARG